MRAAWLEPGGAPYLASLRMNQATTWEEFRAACAYNRMPAENMVWADRRGTIGWQAAGIQPLRKNWSGLLPVPGDGRYEWDGFLPITDLPHEVNPSRGFIATANHYLFPNDYPHKAALHYTWADPYRASRITEILGSGRLFSVAETINAAERRPVAAGASARAAARAICRCQRAGGARPRRLLQWDFVLDKDSVAAGIYAMWQRRVLANTRERLVPAALRELGGQIVTTQRIVDWLHAPDGRFGEQPTEARDALLALSLDEAVAELTKRFGADPARWNYGQDGFHHALIRHPLSAVGQCRDARAAVRRPAAARWRRQHGERHRQRRQPDVRRIAQDHRGHRGLGQLGRHQHAGAIGQSRRPALSRSVRALGARQVLHARLLTREGGVGQGKRADAHAADEHAEIRAGRRGRPWPARLLVVTAGGRRVHGRGIGLETGRACPAPTRSRRTAPAGCSCGAGSGPRG